MIFSMVEIKTLDAGQINFEKIALSLNVLIRAIIFAALSLENRFVFPLSIDPNYLPNLQKNKLNDKLKGISNYYLGLPIFRYFLYPVVLTRI